MSRLTPTHSFSYAAQKSQYLSILGAILFLTLSEEMLILFLVLRFVPTMLLQTLILALLGCFLVGMFGKLLCPLWTRHRLSATELELYYGLDIRARLPRALLASAQPVQEKTGAFAVPRYDAAKQRLSLAFSTSGQVLLSLKQPLVFRLGLRTACLADQILMSLDDREAFLTALDLRDTAQTQQLTANDQDLSTSSRNEPRIPVQFVRRELPQIADNAPVVLCAEGLIRRYAGFTAVDSLNLAVRQGEIYGFLGPNGADKSTTIKMLVGLLQPTAGRVWLDGHDVWREPLAAKAALGYVADRALLYNRLSGREFLAFLGQLRGLPLKETEEKIASLLDLLELTDAAERLCGSYSFGMKRKLALAGALLHEPLNGFDPRSPRRLKDLFARLAAGGTAIFLSTHDLATAEEICQRIGILHGGRLLAEGSPAELLDLAPATDLESVFLSLTDQTSVLTCCLGCSSVGSLLLWIGLSLLALLLALALLSLILVGYVAMTVLGSVLDADLTQVAEDTMQILMLEEMPMTPRRLQLLGVTILHFGIMLLLCWKLPMPSAFLALIGLDALLLVVGERVGRGYIARLLC